jgi:hypothetical protein
MAAIGAIMRKTGERYRSASELALTGPSAATYRSIGILGCCVKRILRGCPATWRQKILSANPLSGVFIVECDLFD